MIITRTTPRASGVDVGRIGAGGRLDEQARSRASSGQRRIEARQHGVSAARGCTHARRPFSRRGGSMLRFERKNRDALPDPTRLYRHHDDHRHHQLRAGGGLRRARPLARTGASCVAVTTTGIYCRAELPRAPPRPENTRYFCANNERSRRRPASALQALQARLRLRATEEAVRAGDRPAVRAGRGADRLALERAGRDSPVIRPRHFQRVFTRATGLSPAAYARALRDERAREALSDRRRR